MENQVSTDNSTKPPEQPKPPRILWAIKYIKGYLKKPRSQKEKQAPADRAALSTARATWAIAALTFVTAGVGWSQYKIFDRQLKVMQDQLDVMLRDQEPHFMLTDKFVAPIFKPVSDGNGYVMWNVPWINSGKGAARDITVNTYISLDYGPFVRSNTAFRGEPIKSDEAISGAGGWFTIASQQITKTRFDEIRAKELAISIFFEFEYFDQFGKRYTTPICYGLYTSGVIASRLSAECKKNIQE